MKIREHTRCRARIRASRGGYTLVEMLTVGAIVALLVAIVIPRIGFQQKGADLSGAANEMVSALRAARREAIIRRELRALALDLYSIPGQFVMMRERRSDEPLAPLWIAVGESHQLPNNVAIVAAVDPGWTSVMDITRTGDSQLNGNETSVSLPLFNPSPGDGFVNAIYHLIRFYPTGTSESKAIYLWNITEDRREIPNPTPGQSTSNITALGVPPGLMPNIPPGHQDQFFKLQTGASASTDDAYYYTLVVSRLTGSVTVYDYAYGTGGTVNNWDRKKDGE